jgi:uncharacterized membrane protein
MGKNLPGKLPIVLLLLGATLLVVLGLTLAAGQPAVEPRDQTMNCCYSDCPQDPEETLAGLMIMGPIVGVAFGLFRATLQHHRKAASTPLGLN